MALNQEMERDELQDLTLLRPDTEDSYRFPAGMYETENLEHYQKNRTSKTPHVFRSAFGAFFALTAKQKYPSAELSMGLCMRNMRLHMIFVISTNFAMASAKFGNVIIIVRV